jgi:hypothetical protein
VISKNDLRRPQHFDVGANMLTSLGAQRPDHWPDHFGATRGGHRQAKFDVHVNANRGDSHAGEAYVCHFDQRDQTFRKTNSLFNEAASEKQQRFSGKRGGRIVFTLFEEVVDVSTDCHQLVPIRGCQQSLRGCQIHIIKPMCHHSEVKP